MSLGDRPVDGGCGADTMDPLGNRRGSIVMAIATVALVASGLRSHALPVRLLTWYW